MLRFIPIIFWQLFCLKEFFGIQGLTDVKERCIKRKRKKRNYQHFCYLIERLEKITKNLTGLRIF